MKSARDLVDDSRALNIHTDCFLWVLLQQGKGADVSAAFGASSSQTTFGARGATTLLEKITTWSFVAFSVLAVTISLIQARPRSSAR